MASFLTFNPLDAVTTPVFLLFSGVLGFSGVVVPWLLLLLPVTSLIYSLATYP
ncbi:hypothetical protein LIZ77_03960 [Clostridium perfringens]|uniref:hypothetical protein n=1 Tax=Clostridium perfringens TaxID=1502 RepID=UPI00224831B7|nr:hypothetical protein [Clostridium perfringens]